MSILTALNTGAHGDVAVRYAADLAASIGAPLRVINPYTVPITLGEMPMPMLPVEEVRAAAEARINETTADIKARYPQLDIRSAAAYGALPDILEEEATKDRPILTVISHEEGEDPDVWMGGDSTDILREGNGSILVVASSSKFSRPENICLACDSNSIREGLPLKGLLELQSRLGFRITVLHVVAKDEEPITFQSSILANQLLGVPVTYAELSAAVEVDEAIASFPDTHSLDWIAIAPHHYGFWQGLFHKSHTSRVLHLAHVPVLGLHE